MVHNFIDRTGRVYGALTVLERGANVPGSKVVRWLCRCTCGKETLVRSGDLNSGATQSCGCEKDRKTGDRARTHGASKTSTYSVWQNMHTRCYNEAQEAYKNYGARGVTVCERWHSFSNFLADMGYHVEGMSLERRDNDGNYAPGNCYWATRAAQNRNKRVNKWLTAGGETMVQADWAARLGISSATLKERLDRGWGIERACLTPRQSKEKTHGI